MKRQKACHPGSDSNGTEEEKEAVACPWLKSHASITWWKAEEALEGRKDRRKACLPQKRKKDWQEAWHPNDVKEAENGKKEAGHSWLARRHLAFWEACELPWAVGISSRGKKLGMKPAASPGT